MRGAWRRWWAGEGLESTTSRKAAGKHSSGSQAHIRGDGGQPSQRAGPRGHFRSVTARVAVPAAPAAVTR